MKNFLFLLLVTSFVSVDANAERSVDTIIEYQYSLGTTSMLRNSDEVDLSEKEQADFFCEQFEFGKAHSYRLQTATARRYGPYGRNVSQILALEVRKVDGEYGIYNHISDTSIEYFNSLFCAHTNVIKDEPTTTYTSFLDRKLRADFNSFKPEEEVARETCHALGHKDVASFKTKHAKFRKITGWDVWYRDSLKKYAFRERGHNPFGTNKYFEKLVCSN